MKRMMRMKRMKKMMRLKRMNRSLVRTLGKATTDHHRSTIHSSDLPSTRTWTTPATLDSEYAVVRAMQQEDERRKE
jgi:hypothetical protein